MKLSKFAGATSEIWQVFIRDSSSTIGAGLTGLTNASASLTAYYHRDTDTTATVINLVTMTVGTFTSSGFKEIDATNMPGWYQFCPPNAALASGAKSCGIHLKGATNMAPLPIEVQLTAVNPDSATAFITSVATVTTVTNQLTAAAIATGVWTDATAGDFTAALSVGKSVMNGVTLGTGLTVAAVSGAVGSVAGAVGSVTAGVTVTTNNDKTGYSLTQSFPTNFAALGISVGGHISNVDTLTTYTGDTPQTGDSYARIGAAGAGLTALGDTRIAHLDADVSGRMATFTLPTHFSSLAIDVSGDVTFNNSSIATVTNLTNLPSIPANWLTATGIAAAALNGKGDWNIGKTGYSISGTITTLDGLATHGDSSWATATGFATPTNITAGTITTTTNLTNAPTSGDFTTAMKTSLNAATPASVTGSVGSVTGLTAANLDVAVSTRLAASSYTAPDNTDIAAIRATTDGLVQTAGKLWVLDGSGNAVAPASQTQAIQNRTDNLPSDPADESLIIAATDALASAIAAISVPTANQTADAWLDRADAIEIGLTPRQAMRLSAAIDAGKLSGGATTTNTIRNAVADSKDRIVATVDTDGNRSAVTLDLT